jgi:hypothetical protein
MAYVKRHRVIVTTDSLGDAESYTDVLTGRLISITYTKDDYAAGVDFAITGETTGIGIWTESDVNATKTVSPRQPTHTQVGVENDTAGDVLLADIYLAQERIKIVIDEGGDEKSGTFDIIVEGPTG